MQPGGRAGWPRSRRSIRRVPNLERADVEAAYERIAGRVRTTPVLDLEPGALGVPGRLTLKLELLQHTGSVKARGALNRILAGRPGAAGVIAASGGNFGVAVAYAAREVGCPAEVFVPAVSSPAKREWLDRLGATVQVVPGFYADALRASAERAAQTGALVMHAYDQPDVVAGQGTVAVELSGQAPAVDTVLVAVGGGGLLGGVATWYAGSVRVVAVEPELAPTLHAALAAGHPVDVDVAGVAADSLGARRIGDYGFAAAQRYVTDSVLVSDEDIRAAQQRLWAGVRLLAEPGGAAAFAGLLAGAYRPAPDERVAVLVCGANLDPRSVDG